MIRLDKFLSEQGNLTRSEAKKKLKAGLVRVNDQIIKAPEQKIDPLMDTVLLDGKKICFIKDYYLLFHKPQNCITANSDSKDKTVMDFFPDEIKKKCFPVGRLDKDTEGLLIITSDGAFSHHLISPSHHVPKTYYVELDLPIPAEAEAVFQNGIMMDQELTAPAILEIMAWPKDG